MIAPQTRYTFFQEDRENTVRKYLAKAKSAKDEKEGLQYYQKALAILKNNYLNNPDDPIVRTLIGAVRAAVWAEIPQKPPISSSVNQDTFDALLSESNYKKFRERYTVQSINSLPKPAIDT
jgi:hypothetical protein